MTTILTRSTSAFTLGLILIIATELVLPWTALAATTTASFDKNNPCGYCYCRRKECIEEECKG